MTDLPLLKLISLEDLFRESPEECDWLVENMLPLGAVSLLVAKPKVGKTTTAETILYGVATGTPVFGRTTKQGRVLYLQLEASSVETASHFKRMGATGQEPITLHVGPITVPDPALAVEVAIRQLQPVLVVVDSIQRLMKFRDINDYAQVIQAIEPYVHIAHAFNTHFMFLHHLGKDERKSSSVSDAILGSSGLFASVDMALIMSKNGDVRTIQTDGPQRFGVNLLSTVLHFDPETNIVSAGEQLSEARRKELSQHILNALGDTRLSMAEIKSAVGGDNAKTHKEVVSLYEAGLLVREGSGKSRDPYLFRIREANT